MLGFVKIAELLLGAGADVNAVMELDSGGQSTVLLMAVSYEKREMIQLLLNLGAAISPSSDVVLDAAL
jgi:hypothetical protein